MSGYDETVTIIGNRNHGNSKSLKTSSALNTAQRNGGSIISEKKSGLNVKKATEGSKIAAVDRKTDEGIFEVVKVSTSVSKAIADGRRAKELTQKDLATKINEKPQVVNEYESGKATPNQQVLAKMERVLGIKLRGKDIGSPLPARGAKK
ncbi:multiprotein-bridging factor 1 [Boothiomyces sp. JEL0866]|nr:multiprotein-bridging factor 1 [Boothiomyces sp. JEL0866]